MAPLRLLALTLALLFGAARAGVLVNGVQATSAPMPAATPAPLPKAAAAATSSPSPLAVSAAPSVQPSTEGPLVGIRDRPARFAGLDEADTVDPAAGAANNASVPLTASQTAAQTQQQLQTNSSAPAGNAAARPAPLFNGTASFFVSRRVTSHPLFLPFPAALAMQPGASLNN